MFVDRNVSFWLWRFPTFVRRCAALGSGCVGYAVSEDETQPGGKVFLPYSGWFNFPNKRYLSFLDRTLEGNWSSWRKRSVCAATRHKSQLRHSMRGWMAEFDSVKHYFTLDKLP